MSKSNMDIKLGNLKIVKMRLNISSYHRSHYFVIHPFENISLFRKLKFEKEVILFYANLLVQQTLKLSHVCNIW
jgi:hypothetical protein